MIIDNYSVSKKYLFLFMRMLFTCYTLVYDLREKYVAPCAWKISKAPAAIKVIYIHFHGFQRVAQICEMTSA